MRMKNSKLSMPSDHEWEAMSQDAEDLGLFSLSIDELNLVLGGNAPSSGQEDMPPPTSGGFQQAIGNIANASAVGAVVGGVAGATIGAFLGPAGAAAGGAVGEWAGVGTGAAVGTFLGGSVAGAAASGYEVGIAYPGQVNGIVDGFSSAAQEYQNNPPPI